jgi:polysaccharide biosynthesis protein PslH
LKILFVSLFLPREKSFHAGGRFVFEILKELSRRHSISLATRVEEGESGQLESLRPFCREIFPYPYKAGRTRNLFRDILILFNYIGFSRFADGLAARGDFDIVQVEWVEAGLLIRRGRTPMILDAHDVITKPAERTLRQSKGIRRLVAGLTYILVRAAERCIAGRADLVISRSPYDKEYLLSLRPGLKVEVVPHPAGLDITGRTFPRRRHEILFLASFRYRKVNVDAALFFYNEVFPLIRNEIPDARFVIAGYGPPVELTSIPGRDTHVTVTGFVDDLDACYKQAEVFVAPILTGGGIIVKILDAMAAGIPVVTTSYGNEGIGAVPARDMLVADDPANFAKSVIGMMNDHESARRIAENGQDFVRENFSMASVTRRFEAAYREILRGRGTTS